MASREDAKEAAPPVAAEKPLSRKAMQRTSSRMGLPGQPVRTPSSSSTAEPPSTQAVEQEQQDQPMHFMPKAYSEMVPMTRESSFVGPGPIRANSDGIVPFLRMVPDSAPMQDEEIVFVPKSFSEVQMPSNSLSFEQMPASNSDGLLANRAFMRAVDAARAQAAQQKAEEAATRLPGGVKRQAQLCLSQLSMEKLYEGKIVIAFKLGLLVDINADVLGLLRWKHVKGVPRKLLKEGGNLANLRVEKVRGERFTLRLECIGLPGQTVEETEYPDIVARVYDWAIAPKLLDVSVSEEEITPTAAQKQRLGRMGPRNVGDGEGLAIRGPAPFNARRFLRPGKCGPRYSDQP
ncbi:unnamed protein product [Symbiodinium sp. CCMP2592]|nr:unnamed protein product [Symbiodinium sp. CCMP2592]